ncbi:NADPH-dependent FMN reductase, partial [Knoellia remsis]
AIVIVTPQYNRSFPATIKNAIDYLYAEWQDKPVAVVGYGFGGAGDAQADLTKVLTHLRADVVGSTGLTFGADLAVDGTMDANVGKAGVVRELLDQLHGKVLDLDAVTAG